jgi:hypothetical protein
MLNIGSLIILDTSHTGKLVNGVCRFVLLNQYYLGQDCLCPGPQLHHWQGGLPTDAECSLSPWSSKDVFEKLGRFQKE